MEKRSSDDDHQNEEVRRSRRPPPPQQGGGGGRRNNEIINGGLISSSSHNHHQRNLAMTTTSVRVAPKKTLSTELMRLAAVAVDLNVRVRSASMPVVMKERAFRYTRSLSLIDTDNIDQNNYKATALASKPKPLSSTQIALAIKKVKVSVRKFRLIRVERQIRSVSGFLYDILLMIITWGGTS